MQFILIQDGVLDVADTPAELLYSLCTDEKDWSVYVGKDHKIIAEVAKVNKCAGYISWSVTSDQDGYERGVGALHTAAEYVKRRLDVLYRNNDFADLGNLPGKIILRGLGSE